MTTEIRAFGQGRVDKQTNRNREVGDKRTEGQGQEELAVHRMGRGGQEVVGVQRMRRVARRSESAAYGERGMRG